MENKDAIAAVKRHHGGFAQATEGQCLALWAALDAATQERYLGQNAEARSQKSEEKSEIGNRK
jgi:hypothetical protein